MRNRIAGVIILISIIVVFYLFFPFERTVNIKIEGNLRKDLREINLVISRDGRIFLSRQYFVGESFSKYLGSIDDSIRLRNGLYDAEVLLLYPNTYLRRQSGLKVGYFISDKIPIDIKE